MRESEFSCTRDKLTVRGTEYRSEALLKQRRCPIAVICHGFGGNQYDLLFYAKEFADMGYAVYCFDFCGGCVVGKSDGSSLDMTIDTEAADLKAVLDYAKSLPYTDEGHILLAGGSQGGYVAGIVAAERQAEIEKLILFYPALCIPDAARTGTLGGASYDVDHVPEAIDTFGVRISKKFHDGVVDKDAVAQISGYRGPVLLIHGSEDRVVDSRYALQAAEAYENCRLQILEGAGHGFTREQREQVIVTVREFLREGISEGKSC
ncbi:MAG: alpha/beta fold hydrolase [Butyrivibrio sp.]|nr:alpha/beta fold hydrolase [Acetatifactor muris]MCM1561709.1 alpha/beta fold hydrolase [Butyrivibrio sp.]